VSTTPEKKPNSIPAAIAAIRTLEAKGYTYLEGAELWRPPLGTPPDLPQQKNRTEFMSLMGQRAMEGNFWTYQGDGEDYLESLTCPVIIHPQRLLGIVEAASRANMALQRIGSALDLMAGSDVTKDAVPAIKALVKARGVPEGFRLIPAKETSEMHDAVMALLYRGVQRTQTQTLLDAYLDAAPISCKGENCTSNSVTPHSAECLAEYERVTTTPKRSGWPFADAGGNQ